MLLYVFITVISSVLANTQVFTLKMDFDLRVLGDRDGANGPKSLRTLRLCCMNTNLISFRQKADSREPRLALIFQ
jgi:hypothetical protein